MSIEDKLPRNNAVSWLARICFTLIFIGSGVTHFSDMPGYVRLMHPAIPIREFWVAISGVVELAGAAMILFDRHARLGAWLIVLFLIPVTITVHGHEMVTNEDARMRAIQLSFFLKGVAMTGGALFITQFGVWRNAP